MLTPRLQANTYTTVAIDGAIVSLCPSARAWTYPSILPKPLRVDGSEPEGYHCLSDKEILMEDLGAAATTTGESTFVVRAANGDGVRPLWRLSQQRSILDQLKDPMH